jgi:uncharacterized membrane protein YccC
VSLAATIGVAVGASFVNIFAGEWWVIALVGIVGLVSGVIEASMYSAPGMYLLLGTILGTGLRFPGRELESALSIGAGALWVLLVAAITDRRRRTVDQQIYLSRSFRALARHLSSLNTEQSTALRARAVSALDSAQDTIGTREASGDASAIALRQGLIVAFQFGELASYLANEGGEVDERIVACLIRVANELRTATAESTVQLIQQERDEFSRDSSLARRELVVAALKVPSANEIEKSPPFRSTIVRLPWTDRIRFGVLLAVAVSVATVITHSLDGPHGFWLPLSVAFIFRPDLGPVIRRAAARTVGTMIGVGIAAAAAWLGNREVILIVLSCAMASLVPWAQRRGHAWTVMVFTPIVFVFLGVVGPDQYLFVPRIVDTSLGAVIVLGIDLVLWSRAPSSRPEQRVQAARRAAHEYQRVGATRSAIARHSLRRNALRAVTQARDAIALAAAEPHPFRQPDETLTHQLDEIERSIDERTANLVTWSAGTT